MDEDLNPPEKSSTEKTIELSGKLTKALETALGKPLDENMQDEVDALATGVVLANKQGLKIESHLENVLSATGLKSYQIGPVVDLMSQNHPEGSEQANFVNKGVQEFRTSQASKSFNDTIAQSLSQPITPEQTETAKKFFGDLVSVNQENAGNLDKSFEALQKATGLEKSAIAKLALDVTNTVYPGDKEKKDLVNEGISKQLQTSEMEPTVEKQKTDPEKAMELSNKLTKELETALGKKLDQNMLDEVDNLASGVVFADKQGTSIDSRLQGVLRETGLKSYQVGPVVDMISKYHEKTSEKATFVNEGVDKFRKIQEKENSEYLNKISDLTLKFNDSLEKELGKPLTESQKDASAKVAMNFASANTDQLATSLEELRKATGLKPEYIVESFDFSGLSSLHQGNQINEQRVSDGVWSFYDTIEKQQDTIEKAGRKFDETIEQALDKPMTPEQREAASQFLGDLISVNEENVGNLDKSFEALQKATGMDKAAIAQLAMDVTNAVYPGDKGKKDLVNDGISKQLQTSEVEVELAQDSFILPGKSGQEKSLTTGGQNKDDIIEAIRKEVIEKQNAFLVDKIAERSDLPIPQQQAFKNQLNTPDKMREYLESDKGKGQVEALMKDKRVQVELAKIESTGYSKVHEQFKESYRDVAWKQETGSKVRVSDVTNANGEKIASIKETTHDTAPTKVTLSDGTEKTIRSYREVDFPKNLESGKGPAHFSMALKDENGRNVPEKDAVYFTAHYDDNGKLMEVSSPKPVKFMGEGADAIGYIERNGQVLTLPVTQGKYKEMMQEVAINNGRSSTVDKSVEQAVDSVAVGSKESPIKAKEKVEEPTVTTRPRSVNVSELDRPTAKELSPPKTEYSAMPSPKSEYGQLPPQKKTGTEYVEFPVDNPHGAKKTNPFTGQVVDPQVAKKAEKLKEGLVDPKPKTPAPKEQGGRPRSQSLPPPKPKGMAM